MLEQDGQKAPSLATIKPDQWEEILELKSKSARRRYYQFLWQNEMKSISEKRKKEEKKIENAERLRLEREAKESNEHINYGLLHNTMFLRIYESTMNKFHNNKLIRAMQFDQKLIIDCSYDQYMNKMEASNTGKQLMISFAENRMHPEPFDLHLCNVDMNSVSARILKKFIPTLLDPAFPLNVHTESMTEKFDKDKLVYLTPHCTNDLNKFNHDDIYIIGAMVDKTNTDPLSLAKAKKQGLRMARLPLDRYLQWGGGSGKSLTINQMVRILLEMKKHADWERALQIVPRRKLAENSAPERRNFTYEQSQMYQENRRRHQATSQSRDFDESPRRNFDEREGRSFERRSRNYEDREGGSFEPREGRNFEQRENRNFVQRESRNFDNRRERRNFDDRRSNDFDEQRSTQRPSQERKHFDKYRFNLDTWGSKVETAKKDPK